jgi:membrane protein
VRKWREAFVHAAKRFLADDCMGLAQEIAYSSLLAFFPAVAFALGLLGLLHLYDDVQTLLATVAPHGVIRFIETLQQDTRGGASVAAFALGLAGATWAASGAMGTMVKAVNRAYELPETRSFWKRRLISILLVALAALTVAAVLMLGIFGGPLGDAVARRAHAGNVWQVIWSTARWPIELVAILLFFSFIYNLAPNREQRRWRWITPGSVVGALLWLGLSALFTLYVTYAGSYSKTYGTIAAGVILLLWLNYTAWAILFGAELDAELERSGALRDRQRVLLRRVRV